MPAISIVVPVYKAEKYLHRCVDSILSQTFADFEVLLIDDGSPDGSGLICDAYAERDSRVRVFHKKNGGVASARELGVQNAKGEYIIHADSDDWVEPDMLEEMFRAARESNADMVICDYFVEIGGVTKYVEQRPSGKTARDMQIDLLAGKLHGSLCNKLVKRKCYEGVHFIPEMTYEEDLLVNILILKSWSNVLYQPKAVYHYDYSANADSLSKKYNIKSYKSEKILLQIVNDKIKNDEEKFVRAFNFRYTQAAYFAFTNNLLTSAEYKNEFRSNVVLLKKNDAPVRMRVFTVLSAYGLRSIAYIIYNIMNNIHSLLLKI